MVVCTKFAENWVTQLQRSERTTWANVPLTIFYAVLRLRMCFFFLIFTHKLTYSFACKFKIFFRILYHLTNSELLWSWNGMIMMMPARKQVLPKQKVYFLFFLVTANSTFLLTAMLPRCNDFFPAEKMLENFTCLAATLCRENHISVFLLYLFFMWMCG